MAVDEVAGNQERLLEEALATVKNEAFQMKRCLDNERLMDALKHASQLLSELRTSALSPKYYYRLYIDVTNELQHLEMFLVDEFTKGRKVRDLYELVQYAGNIIPRLYLLITVGMVYIKVGEWKKKDILCDLVEMCRGVQHPLRGLFLRNYLIQCTRGLLPDTVEDNEQGSLTNALDFILLNFSEMNKLWVRMQHQGPTKEQDKREKERRELRILVGTNLVRLSQLDSLEPAVYAKTVLPSMLEQVVSCKDPLAQEYLMECIIQVFPDAFHLLNLSPFLNACADLHPGVQVKNILITLIERIALYAISQERVSEDMELFEMFNNEVEHIVGSREGMPCEDAVALELALLKLALKCYAHRFDYADSVLQTTTQLLENMRQKNVTYNSPLGKELSKLLHLPVDHYRDVLKVLQLEHYPSVLTALDRRGRRAASAYILNNILDNSTQITTQQEVDKLLTLLSAVVKDEEGVDPADDDEMDAEDFAEEQNLVARLIPLLQSSSPDHHYSILSSARKHLGCGGPKRILITLPPIIFAGFQLAHRFKADSETDEMWGKKVQKMVQFCYKSICALQKETETAELPLRLFLQGALLIDNIPFSNSETVAYEFMTQAFSLYEEEISESKAQVSALMLMMGTLERMKCFGVDNAEPLRSQAAVAAAKLFKKPEQCRAVANVAHVFWSGQILGSEGPSHDGKRVEECLRKSLKIASQCMDPAAQVQLFLEVLNHNIFFLHDGCENVTVAYVNQVISKIRETLPQLEQTVETKQIEKHLENTTAMLRQRMENGNERYQGLVL